MSCKTDLVKAALSWVLAGLLPACLCALSPTPALAQSGTVQTIRYGEIVDMEELGMEAVRKIEVVDFPAVILVDDKGNDFFADILRGK